MGCAGHAVIEPNRSKGAIWERPWPSWKLIAACETTQVIGTLVVVYGWFVTPIGWGLALMVWGYALVFFLISSALKIATYRLLGHLVPSHVRHLTRIEGHVAAHDISSRLAGAKPPLPKAVATGTRGQVH